LVCAAATARYLLRLAPRAVTLVVTGIYLDRDGDEDLACADYLAALLRGEHPDTAVFARRVRESDFGRRFTDPDHPATPSADLDYCAVIDCFDFAMPVERRGDLLVMTSSS
jgi:2-phosphosulfolactate phosphatase